MNSRLKFPRRVRIHGGECGAVARALHHEAQKDALMSYERAFLCKADFEKASKSTIERKQMSIKTTLKRIALVAVSSLGLGLMSVLPANAGVGDVTAAFLGRLNTTVDIDGSTLTTYSATSINSTTTLATDAPGVSRTSGLASNATSASFVALTVPQGSRVVFAITSVDGTQAFGTSDLHTLIINGQTVKAVAGTAATENTLTYDVSSTATVGTYAASIVTKTGTSGATTITNNFTFTIATKASSSRSVSADYSSISVVRYGDEAQCTTTTKSAWTTRMATYGISTGYAYGGAVDATSYLVCLNIRSGDDTALTPDSVFLSTGKGFVADSHTSADGTVSGVSVTPASGMVKADLIGDSIQEGATTITAVITYNSGAITLTTPFTWYGDLASLTLSNYSYAQSISASAAAGTNNLFITAKDDQGNVIPYEAWSDATTTGKVRTALSTGSAADLKLVSSNGNGAATTTRGQSNAYASVLFEGQRDLSTDVNSPYGTIDIDCATSRAESIDVTVYGYNVLTLAQDIASNTVTFVCSSATAASVTVSPAKSEVAAGGTTTLQVLVKDANGLIVPDGTSVTLATSNGNAITGGSTSTTNGALYTAATFVGSTDDNVAIVTGAAGAVTGNASIKVGTGISKANASADAAADAAAEAIDAANAATDAANLAAEAADAATVAAEEARDAADAATAAVEELATQVATLMSALKAQITTLANTVAKIAKKVKA